MFAALIVGCASNDDDQAAETTTAATTTAPVETEPAQTLPTPETVKLAIFERAYSECASFKIPELAGKYKVAKKTEKAVAEGVARGWVKFFEASNDAIPEGRSGCLAGFKDKTSDN